jgi:hypothetical protein
MGVLPGQGERKRNYHESDNVKNDFLRRDSLELKSEGRLSIRAPPILPSVRVIPAWSAGIQADMDVS